MGTQVWTPKTGTLPDTTTIICSSPTNWSNSARNHLKVAVQRSSIAIRAKCSYECLRNGFPGDISVQSLTGKVCVLNRQRVSCGKDGRSSLKSSTAWETTPLRRSTRSNFGQRRSAWSACQDARGHREQTPRQTSDIIVDRECATYQEERKRRCRVAPDLSAIGKRERLASLQGCTARVGAVQS